MRSRFRGIVLCCLALSWSGFANGSASTDLESRIAAVRRQAAIDLGRAGASTAVPGLIRALDDPEPRVRREAAKSLARIKRTEAVPALIGKLEDPDEGVRFYAAYALGEVRDQHAVGPLLAAMTDPSWNVRDHVAWALRKTVDDGVVKAMAEALAEPEPDLDVITWILQGQDRQKAVARLAKLISESSSPQGRRRAATVLAELGGEASHEPLLVALKDADAGVRLAAVRALTPLRMDRAEEMLRRLAGSDPDKGVQEAAREAVGLLLRHDKLVAFWSFDDRNASIARDVTGRGIDGEIKGATPVKGKEGYALKFTGGQYVELGRPAGLQIGNTPLTIAAWARPESPNGVVVARGGAFCGFSLYVKDGFPKFGIHREKEGPAYIAAGETQLDMGKWVHLAGVVRDDRVEIAVDGTVVASMATPGPIPGNCGQGMEIGFDTANSPCEITDPFEGVIDEVRVYHAPLSEKELRKLVGVRRDHE